MANFVVKKGLDNISDAKIIRKNVFIDEQGFQNEFDETDDTAYHVVGYVNNLPVCCARFFSDDKNQYHIGRIAVIKEKRSNGYGREIILFCEKEIKKLGGSEIYLSAQTRVCDFYKSLGYIPFGEEYSDEHVMHTAMKKALEKENI